MIIKDAMVMIHMAKITLLEKSCQYFKKVMIPKKVYEEVLRGKENGYPDVNIILDLIKRKKVIVRGLKNKGLIKKAEQFNIQRGEAEAVALYWEENADYLATDDDNVRSKCVLLNIRVIGTPAIILKIYKENMIEKSKFEESLNELRKIG